MAKRQRKYGEAWKDVRIDAEQNDAVFDRFFKRTSSTPADNESEAQQTEEPFNDEVRPEAVPRKLEKRVAKRVQSEATVDKITRLVDSNSPITIEQMGVIKQQYRLSKGEVAIFKHLLQLASDAHSTECYAKIPILADICDMTHRGCQFALKNLQARGLISRIGDYSPANRLGIKFQINLPLK